MAKKHPRDVLGMADADILSLVISEFAACDNLLSARLTDFNRYYMLYRSQIAESDIRPHGANLYVPYTFSQIETMVPKWFNSLFGTKPYGTFLPVGDGNPKKLEKAKKMEQLTSYQLDQKIRIVEKGNIILKDVAIYGTCFTKQTWKLLMQKRKVKEPISVGPIQIPGTSRIVTKDVKVADDPDMKIVSVFNFRYDVTADNIKDAAWCGEYNYLDVRDVQNLIANGTYKSSPELTEYLKGIMEMDATTSNPGYQYGGIASKRNRTIEVMEYYTDEAEVHIINKMFVARKVENPFHHGGKPYARWAATIVRGEMLGIGIPEIVESLQIELNTTRNQRIDNIGMAINRMWKARRNANIDVNQLISKPNGIIWLDEMDDLADLQMDDVTGESRYHEEIIKKDIDEATGMLDSIRGTSTDRRETATSASLMHQSGGDRIKASTILLDVVGLGDALGQIGELNQQFITEETYLNVFSEDGVASSLTISPDDMLGRYEIAVASAGTDPAANKEVVRNQLTTLYQSFSQSPIINQEALVRRIFEAYDLKNIDELILTQQPVLPEGAGDLDMMNAGAQMGDPMGQQMGPGKIQATQEQIQMIMQAFETGEKIPDELIPLAEQLLSDMKNMGGAQ